VLLNIAGLRMALPVPLLVNLTDDKRAADNTLSHGNDQ
jgi:hypothetical protein